MVGGKGKPGARGGPRPDNPELAGGGRAVHIGFSTHGGWLSAVIRWATRARVSHSFIVHHDDAFGAQMVLEASGHGFRTIAWRRFDADNRLIALYRLKLPDQAVGPAMVRLADRLGDAYDTLSLFGYLLRKWFRLARTPFNARDKLVCSEAVALFLGWAGVEVPDAGNVISPNDLFHLARSRPDLFELVRLARSARLRKQFRLAPEPPALG